MARMPKAPARPGLATWVHQQRPLSGSVAAKGARHYSREQRREAVALAYEVGQKAASRQLGIPYSTVCGWLNKSRRDMKAMQPFVEQLGLPLADWEVVL